MVYTALCSVGIGSTSSFTNISYVAYSYRWEFAPGYPLIDCVQNGRMLSEIWKDACDDRTKRTTLFHDHSRIILSLAQTIFPRIGSLTIDNHGIISLANRPLTLQLHQRENEGIRASPLTSPDPKPPPQPTPTSLTSSAVTTTASATDPTRSSTLPTPQAQLSALTMMRAGAHPALCRPLAAARALSSYAD